MKRILSALLMFVVLLSVGGPLVMAQELEEGMLNDAEMVEAVQGPEIAIEAEESLEVEKNMIFRANTSGLPEGATVREYLWDFDDGQFSSREEVVHLYREPGRYTVKLSVTWQPEGLGSWETSEYMKEIFVFERSLVLITDLQQTPERIEALQKRAEDQNVYLKAIRSEVNFRLKTRFLRLIDEEIETIESSDSIIIWSDQVELLTILNSTLGRLDFSQKDLVVITDGNIGLIHNILTGVYSVLAPERIVITRREAIDEFFTTGDGQDVVEVIRERGYDFDLIDEETISEFNLFALPSYGISYLQERGVEDSVILAVLFLPVIVTIVTFMRLVIGMSSISVRMPIVFAYTFLVLGLKLGAAVIVLLSIISYIFRRVLFRSHLLYAAKVGVLTSFLGLVLLLVIGAVVYFNLGVFDFANVLMLILLATMVDRVAGVEGERGWWSVIRVFLETIIIAAMGYGVVSWDSLQVLLLSHPEVLLFFIVANIFMGRFTGLRLLEYFRFREVLRYTEE